MLISDLKPGILLKPKVGFIWRVQNSAYANKPLCLTVTACENHVCDDDEVVIYVGERDPRSNTYGKQIVLWRGKKISVNPAAWRCITPVK